MEVKCYRAMRRAKCVVLKKFSQHVIAETLTSKKCQRHLHHLISLTISSNLSRGPLDLFLILAR